VLTTGRSLEAASTKLIVPETVSLAVLWMRPVCSATMPLPLEATSSVVSMKSVLLSVPLLLGPPEFPVGTDVMVLVVVVPFGPIVTDCGVMVLVWLS